MSGIEKLQNGLAKDFKTTITKLEQDLKAAADNNKKRFAQLEEIQKALTKLKHSDGGYDTRNRDEVERLTNKYDEIVKEIQRSQSGKFQ